MRLFGWRLFVEGLIYIPESKRNIQGLAHCTVRREAKAWVVTRPQAAYTYMYIVHTFYNVCSVLPCLSLLSPPLRGWRRVISKKAPIIDALGSSFAYYVNDTKINPLPLDSLPLQSLEGRL